VPTNKTKITYLKIAHHIMTLAAQQFPITTKILGNDANDPATISFQQMSHEIC
jgi:hypothetical protein